MLNIYGLLIEQLDYERLIEEGRDPVEVLRYKYQDVPSRILDAVISLDPTKKKSYSQWVLSKWHDESGKISEYIKDGRLQRLFAFMQRQKAVQAQSLPSVEGAVEMYVPNFPVWHKTEEPTVWVANLGKMVDSSLANDFDIVYQSNEWMVAVPNTYEAECQLGEGMHWCTANAFGNGKSYYLQYLRDYGGKYYVNIDLREGETSKDNGKEYPYTRYQFHFESNQFMDQHDDPISFDSISMPDDVCDFYESEGKDAREIGDDELRYERYLERRGSDDYVICDEPLLYLNTSFDDEYEYHEPTEDSEYYLFDENDDRDPISWGVAFKNPNYHQIIVSSGKTYFILESTDSDKVVVANNMDDYSSRAWDVYGIADGYAELPEGIGLFGIGKSEYGEDSVLMYFFGQNGITKFPDGYPKSSDVTLVYRGERNGVHYVEAVCGYHRLYAASNTGVTCLIRGDIPKNSEYFLVGKDGVIEGKYRNYRLDPDLSSDSADDYWLHDEINEDLLTVRNDEGYNIYSRRLGKMIFDEPVDEIKTVKNMLITDKDEELELYTSDFRKIGEFSRYSTEKVESGFLIMLDHNGAFHFIDMEKGVDTAKFEDIITLSRKLDIAVVRDNEDVARIYDFASKKFLYPDVTDANPSYNCLYAEMKNEETIIINLNDMQVIDRGIHWYSTGRGSELSVVQYADNKLNLCNNMLGIMVLESGVDNILAKDDFAQVAVYSNAERTYIANTRAKGKIYTNPEGFICSGVRLNFGCMDIVSKDERATLTLRVTGNGLLPESYKLDDGNHIGVYYFGGDADVPEEILGFYRDVMGQELPDGYMNKSRRQLPDRNNNVSSDDTAQSQNDVTEAFNRILGRIEEACRSF